MIYLAKYFCLLTETDMQYAAKVYRDDRLRRKADALSMDNCKELERLTSIYKGGWTGIVFISSSVLFISSVSKFSFIMRAKEKDWMLKTKLNSWSLKSWTVYDLLAPLNSKELKTKINILVMLLQLFSLSELTLLLTENVLRKDYHTCGSFQF